MVHLTSRGIARAWRSRCLVELSLLYPISNQEQGSSDVKTINATQASPLCVCARACRFSVHHLSASSEPKAGICRANLSYLIQYSRTVSHQRRILHHQREKSASGSVVDLPPGLCTATYGNLPTCYLRRSSTPCNNRSQTPHQRRLIVEAATTPTRCYCSRLHPHLLPRAPVRLHQRLLLLWQ